MLNMASNTPETNHQGQLGGDIENPAFAAGASFYPISTVSYQTPPTVDWAHGLPIGAGGSAFPPDALEQQYGQGVGYLDYSQTAPAPYTTPSYAQQSQFSQYGAYHTLAPAPQPALHPTTAYGVASNLQQSVSATPQPTISPLSRPASSPQSATPLPSNPYGQSPQTFANTSGHVYSQISQYPPPAQPNTPIAPNPSPVGATALGSISRTIPPVPRAVPSTAHPGFLVVDQNALVTATASRLIKPYLAISLQQVELPYSRGKLSKISNADYF
jgi:hypothetical protein